MNAIVVHLHVTGMMCQRNCGTTVANALRALPNVTDAKVSFADAWAEVSFVDIGQTYQACLQHALGAVESVGFAAQEWKRHDIDDSDNAFTIHLQVEGMMCQRSCGATVANALQSVPGVVSAQAIFAERRAWAIFERSESASIEDDAAFYQQCLAAAVDAVECVGFDTTEIRDLPTISTPISTAVPPMLPSLQGFELDTDAAEGDNTSDHHVLLWASNEIALQVGGMSCAVCTGRVERALTGLAGVETVTVVLATSRAVVTCHDDAAIPLLTDECVRAVQAAGYDCEPLRTGLRENAEQLEEARIRELNTWRRLVVGSIAIVTPMAVLHYGNIELGPSRAPTGTMCVLFVLATVAQSWLGRRYYRAAYKAWCGGRVLGMDFLIVLGTTASYVYSTTLFAIQVVAGRATAMMPTFLTGAWLLTFVSVGKFLEAYAKGKTASALQSLMELQPTFASRLVYDDDAGELDETMDIFSLETEDVTANECGVGDYLKVFPGMRIPADGRVVAVAAKLGGLNTPSAYVDESALSGEPFPVTKCVGDLVYGSTINQLSVIVIRVTAAGGSTVLAKIVRLMEDAQRQKAPIQVYADKVAGIFAPFVICLAILTFAAWMALNKGVSFEERLFLALMSSISVVVVACPCALGLATPTAVMVGTGVGASQGLLIKGGAVLEAMHSIDTIVFDKTGTMSSGRAVLGAARQLLSSDDIVFQGLPEKLATRSNELIVWLAACAEAQSEHPLAKAVTNAALSRWGSNYLAAGVNVRIGDCSLVPGAGVECTVTSSGWGSWRVRVGTRDWCQISQVERSSVADEEVDDLRQQGFIAVYVSICSDVGNWAVAGVLGIKDPLDREARSTVSALRRAGIHVWLCTGDHIVTALAVAREVGIDESNVLAGATPSMKADLIDSLQNDPTKLQRSRIVAMVGDGINDSVALAKADVGIAIGAGTEIAVDAADVVLVKSSLHDVVVAMHLSKTVFRRIMLNFFWALAYNCFALPFAAGLLYPWTNFRLPPEFAGLMMAFSSTSVVLSSLLLKMYRKPLIADNGSVEKERGMLYDCIQRSLGRQIGTIANEDTPLRSADGYGVV